MSTGVGTLTDTSVVNGNNLGLSMRIDNKPFISIDNRPTAKGKFIFAGSEKFFIRGVTYGAFRPDAEGNEYHDLDVIKRDFAMMAENGINSVRIPHTMPPRELLDIAQQYGLRVMVGLSAEQYVGYLNDNTEFDIEDTIASKVRAVAGHPAILCYAIGNEIPALIVRWLGKRRVERYLKRIYKAIKSEDPNGIVTYVNYPSTEYLDLPFLDLVSFNVYLESQQRLEAYLARLQNIAGDRPLLMSEVGLDALRNGEIEQAEILDWQIRSAFAGGCAGAFVFSWTDEWFRGGADVDDWEFGITDVNRKPKPSLNAVRQAFADAPLGENFDYPSISVVVCSYNGSKTIRDCLEGLTKLDYPNFEVIVVDDGSKDETADIAREYGFRVISTENRGLSSARNTGMRAATGEIVAYTDDDARPDPHWLTYLARTYLTTDFVGVGGPNIAPPGDGEIADAVANAPGGPVHVLLSDTEAEHIPGCNSSFRKSALEAIGGFDPIYRVAGDDVDVCWRLQQAGGKLGFNPAAMVWHHRRNSVKTYWKQQIGYGKAEALLEQKHPEKYNAAGHLTWGGRLYGKGLTAALLSRQGRIYQGVWGSAPFQTFEENKPSLLLSLPLMPEWYLVVLVLAGLSALGIFWTPLLFAFPLFCVAFAALVGQAVNSALQASFNSNPQTFGKRLKLYFLTGVLHLVQPLARLVGRLRHGLTPWRRRGPQCFALPLSQNLAIWSSKWQPQEQRLQTLYSALASSGAVAVTGGDYDRWDIEVRGGMIGGARLLMACEDNGSGNQFIRVRIWAKFSLVWLTIAVVLATLSVFSAIDGAWIASGLLGLSAALLASVIFRECAIAIGIFMCTLDEVGLKDER
jgi:O-antigen biosynthesis protein